MLPESWCLSLSFLDRSERGDSNRSLLPAHWIINSLLTGPVLGLASSGQYPLPLWSNKMYSGVNLTRALL